MAAEQLVSFMPDWLLFIIVIAFFSLVYLFLPPNGKESVKFGIKRFGIFILLGLAWLYFRKKWGFVYEDPARWPANIYYATFILGFLLILYFAFKSWLYKERYETNQVIADNIHGSCSRYQEIGTVGDRDNWVVFFLGTSGMSDDSYVIPWPWPKKILVVPKVACQFVGNQIFIKSQVAKVDLFELPEDVAHFIETDAFGRWCKDNIYFGLWDIEIKTENPKTVEMESMIIKQNYRINELKEMLKGRLNIFKTFVTDTKAMQDKMSGKTMFRRNDQRPMEE